jgi:hypothetical protein
MPSTNIKTVLYSDTSNQIVDKINNNFDEIVELHGGTEGLLGPTGARGALGENGPVGSTGVSGPRGTRWFIQTISPSGYSQEGDYWIDSDTSQIYQLETSGWNYTGYDINTTGSLFSYLSSAFIPTPGYPGGTGISVGIDQILPQNFLYTLSDVTPEFGITNETLAKFLIATNTSVNDGPILEFSKSNIENGTISDYTKHPVFRWQNLNPTDNSLDFLVPGGSAYFGVSGGFNSNFNTLNVNSGSKINIDYGSTSGGGIYSTGGFSFDAFGGRFDMLSQFLRITGGSAEFRNPVTSVSTMSPGNPSLAITLGGTAGFLSTRSGDTHSTLSHSVNHISLETQNRTEFYLNTKGKLRTNKTLQGITYASGTPGATGVAGSNLINWYFVSKPSTTVSSSVLNDGNTVIISPSVSSGLVGVGFYYNPDNNFGWGATSSGGLKNGESMDVKVYLSSDSPTASFGGISYLGVGATSGAAIDTKVTLPFRASVIDFTIAKGVTGSSVTTVYYKAYGLTGGSGGSFIF